MSDNFNKEYALYRRGKSKYLYLGEVEDTDKYKNPKSFYKTVEEAHQKTFELYQQREAEKKRMQEQERFNKELEKKIIEEVRKTTEREIINVFK